MQSVPFDLIRCCTLEIFEVPAEARKYVPFNELLLRQGKLPTDSVESTKFLPLNSAIWKKVFSYLADLKDWVNVKSTCNIWRHMIASDVKLVKRLMGLKFLDTDSPLDQVTDDIIQRIEITLNYILTNELPFSSDAELQYALGELARGILLISQSFCLGFDLLRYHGNGLIFRAVQQASNISSELLVIDLFKFAFKNHTALLAIVQSMEDFIQNWQSWEGSNNGSHNMLLLSSTIVPSLWNLHNIEEETPQLPTNMEVEMLNYEDRYWQQTSGRKFLLKNDLVVFEIEATYLQKPVWFKVDVDHFAILSLFNYPSLNTQDSVPSEAKQETLKFTAEQLALKLRQVRRLGFHLKQLEDIGVLKREGEYCMLNAEFTSPYEYIDLQFPRAIQETLYLAKTEVKPPFYVHCDNKRTAHIHNSMTFHLKPDGSFKDFVNIKTDPTKKTLDDAYTEDTRSLIFIDQINPNYHNQA
eukprot:TRINITY_DN2795_c0_g1_i1.p1 TRINITY_DN2795_c0_g1~~TRINITY_DN2795_c0_g1_i1.p1  ORF type:complete len:470 (+),score=87.98 TRINITY_DN2795_c0_g1_i1:18-1427(+)